ncbi:MAG: hypothetical protein V1763_02530, partial [Parcubacteria group bacterium]
MSNTELPKNDSQREAPNPFEELKLSLQLNVNDLHLKGFMSDEETIDLMTAIAHTTTIDELEKINEKLKKTGAYHLDEQDKFYEETLAIKVFESELTVAKEGINETNWPNRFASLLQHLQSEYISDYHATLIKSWLAEFFEAAYFAHIKTSADIPSFREQVHLAIDGAPANVSKVLNRKQQSSAGKRMPGFTESIDATLERFEKIEILKNSLK